MKRLLTLILACLLALPTLGALASEAGLYAEQSIALPEGYEALGAMTHTPEGAIAVAARRTDGGWDLLTWPDLSGAPDVLPLAVEGDIRALDIAPDGEILAVTELYPDFEAMAEAEAAEEDAASEKVMFFGDSFQTLAHWLAPDGTIDETVTLDGMASYIRAAAGRQLMVQNGMRGDGVTVYDHTGAEVFQLASADTRALAATMDALYVLEGDRLLAFDPETGAKQGEVPVTSEYTSKLAVGPDGTLYLTDTLGIQAILPGAAEPVRVFDQSGTLLTDPSSNVTGLEVLVDGSIVAMLGTGLMYSGGGSVRVSVMGEGEDSGDELILYTPIDPATAAERQPFTITALQDSVRLRKAVSDFARLHPELDVRLQVQLSASEEAPTDDHIRTLNTDLLAGKGGDVLILDGLPMDKYAARGMLADLSALLPELGLLPGIEAGSRAADGKVYAVPVQFSLETLWANADLLAGVKSLQDMVDAPLEGGQSVMMGRTPEALLRLLYPASEAAFRDDQGQLHFNTPEFAAFLETLYVLHGRLEAVAEIDTEQVRGMLDMQALLSMINGATAFYPCRVDSLISLAMAYTAGGGETGGFAALPSVRGEGDAYIPSLLAGINAMSENQALAEEFIRMLFSEAVQEADQFAGLPTTKASLDKLFAEMTAEPEKDGAAMVSMAVMMTEDGTMLEMKEPDNATYEALRALLDTLTVPATVDETLLGFIVSETEGFFAGRDTAEAAADMVEQRAWFYLNE